MHSDRPKVLFDLAGWPIVRHVVETARELRPARLVVVTGQGKKEVEAALSGQPLETVVQHRQLGTGHAVRQAEKHLADHDGHVLVLVGDAPLVPVETLADLLAHHGRRRAAATILTAKADDPTGYGRILRDDDGRFVAIREHRDATPEERGTDEINSGILAFRSDSLWPALRRLRRKNRQDEYYLTDVPGLLLDDGERVEAIPAGRFEDVIGINSPDQLAAAAAEIRRRIVNRHMAAGVRIVDPTSTWIDEDVRIGAGTTVFPFTVMTGDVRIGVGCEIGPFSHLRAGTRLRDGAQIGNFVEVKKTTVGEGSKAKHLSYLGDATIGAGTNVGCGTITANYDGRTKHQTIIGNGVHVGSGTVFVAPIEVGDGVRTGAGAVLLAKQNVAPGVTVVGVPAKPVARRVGT